MPNLENSDEQELKVEKERKGGKMIEQPTDKKERRTKYVCEKWMKKTRKEKKKKSTKGKHNSKNIFCWVFFV